MLLYRRRGSVQRDSCLGVSCTWVMYGVLKRGRLEGEKKLPHLTESDGERTM